MSNAKVGNVSRPKGLEVVCQANLAAAAGVWGKETEGRCERRRDRGAPLSVRRALLSLLLTGTFWPSCRQARGWQSPAPLSGTSRGSANVNAGAKSGRPGGRGARAGRTRATSAARTSNSMSNSYLSMSTTIQHLPNHLAGRGRHGSAGEGVSSASSVGEAARRRGDIGPRRVPCALLVGFQAEPVVVVGLVCFDVLRGGTGVGKAGRGEPGSVARRLRGRRHRLGFDEKESAAVRQAHAVQG